MILALDIATQTGVAFGDRGGAPTAWSVDLGAGRSEDARFSRLLSLTHSLIEEHRPEIIAVEAPIGGPNTSHFLVGLIACVRGCAFNRGVPVQSCSIAAVRKHFIGKHLSAKDYPGMKPAQAKAAIKGVVMTRCKALGWKVTDADAADAMATWDFACATMGHQTAPVGGLFDAR